MSGELLEDPHFIENAPLAQCLRGRNAQVKLRSSSSASKDRHKSGKKGGELHLEREVKALACKRECSTWASG